MITKEPSIYILSVKQILRNRSDYWFAYNINTKDKHGIFHVWLSAYKKDTNHRNELFHV